MKDEGTAALLGPRSFARCEASTPPLLVVAIDTEEEFDWGVGFSRSNTGVRAMAHIGRVQGVFDSYGVRPVYLVDFPVATLSESVDVLRRILEEGRAELGAHLHPWVNPPHEEEVSPRNSFPGNLPRRLEKAKLERLCEAIAGSFGTRPRTYKAGRYGLGPNTASILEEMGFDIDMSVDPRIDFRPQHGPDYSSFTADPFWFGAERSLLEIPLTNDYVGWLRGWGPWLHPWTRTPLGRRLRAEAVLSRTGALERLWLSPEGATHDMHRRLTRTLLRLGLRVFTFNFHSPSVLPGCTPYVRTDEDLAVFLDSCRRYFDFFLGELGGVAVTPSELRTHLGPPPPTGG